MITEYGIPIRNIYCMLCYYCEIDPSDYSDGFGDEDFDDIYSLMARLLDDSLRPVLRRGLYREYVPVKEQLAIPHGKIDFEETIREHSKNSRRIHCEHDTFTADNRFNQVIRWTLDFLLGYDGLDKDVADRLEEDLQHMPGVSRVRISKRSFDSLVLNRNNRNYVLVLNICRLVYDMKVMTETGEGRYPDFSLEDLMARIYEGFLRNYCSMKFKDLTVKRDKLDWDLMEGSDRTDLPHMNTDISIYDKAHGRKLIIDAKFYGRMMSGSYEEHETLRNSHLYQIHSYINNDTTEKDVCGMLIYPQVSAQPYFRKYRFRNGRDITVRSINLDTEWSEIEETLQILSVW